MDHAHTGEHARSNPGRNARSGASAALCSSAEASEEGGEEEGCQEEGRQEENHQEAGWEEDRQEARSQGGEEEGKEEDEEGPEEEVACSEHLNRAVHDRARAGGDLQEPPAPHGAHTAVRRRAVQRVEMHALRPDPLQ